MNLKRTEYLIQIDLQYYFFIIIYVSIFKKIHVVYLQKH